VLALRRHSHKSKRARSGLEIYGALHRTALCRGTGKEGHGYRLRHVTVARGLFLTKLTQVTTQLGTIGVCVLQHHTQLGRGSRLASRV
jgi:hypothetical protein